MHWGSTDCGRGTNPALVDRVGKDPVGVCFFFTGLKKGPGAAGRRGTCGGPGVGGREFRSSIAGGRAVNPAWCGRVEGDPTRFVNDWRLATTQRQRIDLRVEVGVGVLGRLETVGDRFAGRRAVALVAVGHARFADARRRRGRTAAGGDPLENGQSIADDVGWCLSFGCHFAGFLVSRLADGAFHTVELSGRRVAHRQAVVGDRRRFAARASSAVGAQRLAVAALP